MDDYNDLPAMAQVMERDLSGFSQPAPSDQMPVPYGGAAVIIQNNRDTTAKRVAVPRDMGRIFANINASAASFGDQYTYAWEAKDKRRGGKSLIEGGTIKLANMLVRAYGNCQVDCDVSETATHIIFKAFFIDFESGLSTARLFQQRKNQNTGMADADRQADIIFQIGQSKAIRNVVLNALSDYATHAIEQSKKGMLKKFESQDARDTAHEFIDRTMEQYEITEAQLVAVIGKRRQDWDVRNLAKAFSMMRAIKEGMVSAGEAFPDGDYAAEQNAEREQENADLRSGKAREAAKPRGKKSEPKAELDKPADNPPGEKNAAQEPHKQPGYKAAGPEAQQQDAKPAVLSPQHEAAIKSAVFNYGMAVDFETIEEIRGEAAAAGVGKEAAVTKAYDEARERVKTERAKKAAAKPAETAKPAEPAQDNGADPEIDEEDVIGRIEQMFDGLDTDEAIEEVRTKTMPMWDVLSAGGQKRVQMLYNTAQKRAEAKKAAVAPEESETTLLFGQD